MKVRQTVFDLYWYFAAQRQDIFFKRLQHKEPPYSEDPIFQEYKFCNTYRASDRVSQFLIKNVIYSQPFDEQSLLLRIILFRLLNKIESWQKLEEKLGNPLTIKNFNRDKLGDILSTMKKENPIYGNAFILAPSTFFGTNIKHENHLALVASLMKTKQGADILSSSSLEELFFKLKELPMIGTFMAYQLAIDLNYSPLFDFDENDFTIAGPGALRGIRKCFEDTEGKSDASVIQWMVENQDKEFQRLGISFQSLWGRKLHAIDCQGLFCETDKYCRAKFPQLKSNRVRIKTKFNENKTEIDYFYPPKWKLAINNY